WASARQSWPEAAEAYQAALDAVARLIESGPSREHRQAWLRSGRDLADTAAHAVARSGDLRAAVLILGRWRATLLTAALESDQVPRQPAFSTVAAIAAQAPLAYLAIAPSGGMALLVFPGGRVSVTWLPELARRALSRRAWDYLSRQGGPGW